MKPEKMIELLKGMQSPLKDYAELVGAPAFTYGHKYVYPYPEDYAIEEAIEALKEIQQYREIGTVEECRKSVKEEDALKFYYCESEDNYYIGKRVGNFYYARYGETGFEWFMSRYLPWGEHVIAPNTVWKEYTYPSEPKEIPFFEWLQGFIKRYCGGSVEECREAVIKAVDRHTREDGTLDDDISVTLEEVETAFDKEKVIEELDKLTGEECTLHECGIRSERCRPCIAKKAIEIVEKGGIE